MPTYSAKLIVLRGNSGSGKSTVAKRLRKGTSGSSLAVVEQDYIRRHVLKENLEAKTNNNVELIRLVAEFALSRDYDVVLEGILSMHRYGAMLRELKEKCPNNSFYYFDVSFDETLKRHMTKPNAHEFGEKEMREWYKPRDLTHFETEKVIPESYSLEQAVQFICSESKL